MGVKIGGQIERVNGKEMNYGEFVEKYLKKNQVVVVTGLMDDWRACEDWVNDNGQPNLQFFSTHFGKSKVQVADCGAREFTDQKRVEMSVSEFVDHWLKDSVQKGSGNPLLYLKDWHFVKEYPEYIAYRTPLFFSDDWLNVYLDSHRMHKDPETYQENDEICCADYRFVYMGAKGSWTPLHADVFRSYSWSANVCGKKHWLFLTPSQCHLVFDRNMKNCVYDIFEDVSELEFPGLKKAIWLECTQEQNEIVFVPSGWYHQVHNLEDTISINHNWFNAYNLSWVWDLLLRDYNEAKEYIEDIRHICDDFESICQRNLAANTGMNFYDFFIFITRFTIAILVQFCYLFGDHESLMWKSSPIARHIVFNLLSIQKIAMKMNSVEEGVAGQHGFFLDLRETLEDPEFHKLCEVLGGTYGTIHERHDWWFDRKRVPRENFGVMNFIETCRCQIYTPEDLIKLIDLYVQNLSGSGSDKKIWLSKLDEAQLYSEN